MFADFPFFFSLTIWKSNNGWFSMPGHQIFADFRVFSLTSNVKIDWWTIFQEGMSGKNIIFGESVGWRLAGAIGKKIPWSPWHTYHFTFLANPVVALTSQIIFSFGEKKICEQMKYRHFFQGGKIGVPHLFLNSCLDLEICWNSGIV